METGIKTKITVETIVNKPIEKVWEYWTDPVHIIKWNFASDDWHSPFAQNDLKVGGRFLSRMEAKKGSEGFDFSGTYDEVELFHSIAYILDDDRKVKIAFIPESDRTRITETFEAEETNSIELQRFGWQAILDNFKKHVESE